MSFVLCACAINAKDSSFEKAVGSIDSLLFAREEVVEVVIPVERNFSYHVSVITNETERTKILDELYATDLSLFIDAEVTGIMGNAVVITLRTGEAEQELQIISDGKAQYLIITNYPATSQIPEYIDAKRIYKKGPVNAFDIEKLNQLVAMVFSNEDDSDYSGSVSIITSGFTHAVSKWNCAYARSFLDGALDRIGTESEESDTTYDVEFHTGEITYGINSRTGEYYRHKSGNMEYACLDAQALSMIKIHLGIVSATT